MSPATEFRTDGWVGRIAISPNGDRAIVESFDDEIVEPDSIRIWDLINKESLEVHMGVSKFWGSEDRLVGESEIPPEVEQLFDEYERPTPVKGNRVLDDGGNEVAWWPHETTCVCRSADGTRVFAGTPDGRLLCFELHRRPGGC